MKVIVVVFLPPLYFSCTALFPMWLVSGMNLLKVSVYNGINYCIKKEANRISMFEGGLEMTLLEVNNFTKIILLLEFSK